MQEEGKKEPKHPFFPNPLPPLPNAPKDAALKEQKKKTKKQKTLTLYAPNNPTSIVNPVIHRNPAAATLIFPAAERKYTAPK